MNDCVLQVNKLEKSFGKSKILDGINLTIDKGMVYGLIGQNGAGKTTFLRLISGLMKASGGSITIHTDKQYIGYMPQSCRFDDNSRVNDTIRFFTAIKKADLKTSLTLCNKLELDVSKKVKHLSPGQQKKLQIVIAMAGDPDFFVLDEPTAGLDPKATFEMMEIIKSIRSDGKSILVSSHILGDMNEICTHVALIEKGQLIHKQKLEDSYIIKTLHIPYEVLIALQSRYLIKINEDNTILTVNADRKAVSELVKELTAHSVSVFEVSACNLKNIIQQQFYPDGKEALG